jgi:hypothetical protein
MPQEVNTEMDFMVPRMEEDDGKKENKNEEVDEEAVVDKAEEVQTEPGKEDKEEEDVNDDQMTW